jgi:hypothetical protein
MYSEATVQGLVGHWDGTVSEGNMLLVDLVGRNNGTLDSNGVNISFLSPCASIPPPTTPQSIPQQPATLQPIITSSSSSSSTILAVSVSVGLVILLLVVFLVTIAILIKRRKHRFSPSVDRQSTTAAEDHIKHENGKIVETTTEHENVKPVVSATSSVYANFTAHAAQYDNLHLHQIGGEYSNVPK